MVTEVKDDKGFSPQSLKVWTTGVAYLRIDGKKTLLTDEQFAATPLDVPKDFVNLGIWMKDGGPEDGREVGEVTEFYQPEYQQSSDPSRTVMIKAAEDNQAVTWLDTGKVYSSKGELVVDGVNDETFPLVIVQKRRDGAYKYRHGLARVAEFSPETADRGTTEPTSITFKWARDESIGGFYRQRLVLPDGVTESSVVSGGSQ